MHSVFDQIYAFLVTIVIGFLAGILFDIYRVFRGLWQPRKLGTFIGDLIFWLIMTFLVFVLLLIGNWGEIRIYVFIGMTVGAYLYVHFLSKKWQKVIRKIFIFIAKILTKLWKIISWPFKIALKIIFVPIGFFFSGIAGGYNFIKKILLSIRKKDSNDELDDEDDSKK